jgi:hypothetical protein
MAVRLFSAAKDCGTVPLSWLSASDSPLQRRQRQRQRQRQRHRQLQQTMMAESTNRIHTCERGVHSKPRRRKKNEQNRDTETQRHRDTETQRHRDTRRVATPPYTIHSHGPLSKGHTISCSEMSDVLSHSRMQCLWNLWPAPTPRARWHLSETANTAHSTK